MPVDRKKYPVGTLVRGWGQGTDHRGGHVREGTIADEQAQLWMTDREREDNYTIHIIITKSVNYSVGERVNVWYDTIEVVRKFDPAKPVKTRAGYPVMDFDPDKMTATVQVPGKGDLKLSFNSHGYLYKGLESPVDLVN